MDEAEARQKIHDLLLTGDNRLVELLPERLRLKEEIGLSEKRVSEIETEIKAKLDSQALQVIGGGPDRLKEIVARDLKRWAEVIKTAGIQPE